MKENELLLAFYGDDFTGSADAMESLAISGYRTVLFLEPPTPRVEVVSVGDAGEALLMDSIAKLTEADMGKVVACGSHGGTSSAEYADHCNVRGVIFNDAGVGKDNVGMEGIKRLETKGIAAATVSCLSARIGDALDTFQNGVISAVNQMAENSGVRIGMTTKEALNLMLRI